MEHTDDLKNLHKALEQSTFVKSAKLSKKRTDGIQKFYYFKDKEKELYYNVGEKIETNKKTNKKEKKYLLYSVTKEIK